MLYTFNRSNYGWNSSNTLVLCTAILYMVGGAVGLILGIRNRSKYEANKKEIEEKTGKKVGLFSFKDKKEVEDD